MIYIGVDLHQQFCMVTTVNANGDLHPTKPAWRLYALGSAGGGGRGRLAISGEVLWTPCSPWLPGCCWYISSESRPLLRQR